MDAWFEEEQQVYAHARDPYKRVDILPRSRHVRILFGGVTIADPHRPLLLVETGLPIRYYIPEQDIQMEFLEPTETTTHCPYKGMATYWSARIGEKVFRDLVWSYQEPLPECTPIAHFLCMYNEHVDAIFVDDSGSGCGSRSFNPATGWCEGAFSANTHALRRHSTSRNQVRNHMLSLLQDTG